MTLTVAWVRKVKNTEELIIASDSRLRNGCAWDCCPKILTLARTDCVLAFEGDTQHAYPLMLQIKNHVELTSMARDRSIDITHYRNIILKLINGMRDFIHDLPVGDEEPEMPEVSFIFAGYSWQESRYYIWRFVFDRNKREFWYESSSTHEKQMGGTKYFSIIGDVSWEARKKLIEILQAKGTIEEDRFDYEPFELLVDFIRDESKHSVGGPPQMVKIYRSMSTMPYHVYWPNRESGKITYMGRTLLDFELPSFPIMDPDTLEIVNLKRVEEPRRG